MRVGRRARAALAAECCTVYAILDDKQEATMRAGPIQAENLDIVAAILTTARKTFSPLSAEAIVREYYGIRDLIHEEEIRRLGNSPF